MGMESKNQQLLSKIAAGDGHGENSPYFDGWKAYDLDPFHPTHNPSGVIQMGLAENQLSSDLIEDWIMENPAASICTPQGVHKFKDIANFQDYHGLPEFRQALAKFMSRARGGRVEFDPDRIVMSGGATGANELIIFCLADRGDAFLVPSPYYPANDRDLRWRTGAEIVPVHCDSSNGFKITREALEKSYSHAMTQNINVRGVLLTNPSNPLGTILDRATLTSVITFINEKNIHLVVDEIYAATVFAYPNFVSVSEVVQEMGDSCNPNLVHIVYSLSKDMGLPGFRVGIVYSLNDDVVTSARKMSSFGLVSSQTQYFLAAMLSDDEFVEKFLAESKRRLAARHGDFTGGLEELGIGCLESNAGLYVWMDLRKLLEEETFDAEMRLWKTIINEVKLNVSPGSSFHCVEPGWFRVCFANMDDDTVHVALKRIRVFLGKKKAGGDVAPAPAKRKRFLDNLRLSMSASRRYEESILSPHVMASPHSPLVRAI